MIRDLIQKQTWEFNYVIKPVIGDLQNYNSATLINVCFEYK